MLMKKISLLLVSVAVFSITALAQRTVSGKVTDEKGNPFPNVSVIARGTTTGTSTKADGTYILILPVEAKSLVFTSMNLNSVEFVITANNVVNAKMKFEDRTMSKTVIVAIKPNKE